jgi:hypothetical protein
MAPPRLTRNARLRYDGGDPAPCKRGAAPANETQDLHRPAALIRWSIQEIRRIAGRLSQRRIEPAQIIAWSFWRRAHQAKARQAHLKLKMQL